MDSVGGFSQKKKQDLVEIVVQFSFFSEAQAKRMTKKELISYLETKKETSQADWTSSEEKINMKRLRKEDIDLANAKKGSEPVREKRKSSVNGKEKNDSTLKGRTRSSATNEKTKSSTLPEKKRGRPKKAASASKADHADTVQTESTSKTLPILPGRARAAAMALSKKTDTDTTKPHRSPSANQPERTQRTNRNLTKKDDIHGSLRKISANQLTDEKSLKLNDGSQNADKKRGRRSRNADQKTVQTENPKEQVSAENEEKNKKIVVEKPANRANLFSKNDRSRGRSITIKPKNEGNILSDESQEKPFPAYSAKEVRLQENQEVQKMGSEQTTQNLVLRSKNVKLKELHEKEQLPVASAEVVSGVLEINQDGTYGFLRRENYLQGHNDLFISAQFIRRYNLRDGDFITGPVRTRRETDRYQAIQYIYEVNGQPPEKMIRRPHFDRLTAVYPDDRFVLEIGQNELSTRIIDLVAPIGKGQRGMIVSPPKAGKTVLLQKIANSISANNKDAKLIVLLIDERPEEVTDMQRSIQGEVVYSTFDKTPENHVRIVELVLERAMRLVEIGQDVVILLDSITRLSRAYNLTINPTGRTLSGGLDPGALYGPKRFFGAARNIENGGSLTIIATALIDTGSRMDEVIFEEFKGTGNMEVYLDRKLSEKRIFPAIDINRSGTRREDLLLSTTELDAVWAIRKAMGQLDNFQVTEMIINLLLKTKSNNQFVQSVNVSFNDKAVFEAMRGMGKPNNSNGGNNNANNSPPGYGGTGYNRQDMR